MPIHCKTDMLLIPPRSTSQNQFFFPSFVYLHSVYLFFFPFSPLVHTQNPIPLKTTHQPVKSEMHMCRQKDSHVDKNKLTPLFFINPQVHKHTHTCTLHTHSNPPVGYTCMCSHTCMQTLPYPLKAFVHTHTHTHIHTVITAVDHSKNHCLKNNTIWVDFDPRAG